MKAKGITIGMLALFFAFTVLVTASSANISGAIYTSLGDGTGVNTNQYDYKCDVFLNGGPPPNASCDKGHGLPDGCYVYQVTAPPGGGQNETLLSQDSITRRFIKVSGGFFVHDDRTCAAAAAGLRDCFTPPLTDDDCGDTCDTCFVNNTGNGEKGHDAGIGKCSADISGNISARLMPFADTPNNGGVYKVYATRFADLDGILTGDYDNTCGGVFGFIHDNSKTDNFKVTVSAPPPQEPKGAITIFKFCDANANGILDPVNNENNLGLLGWEMSLNPDPNKCSGPTTADGLLYCSNLDPTDSPFLVTETFQAGFSHTATCVDGFCGYCSITTTTPCNINDDCLPDGGTCMPNPVNPASITITGSETHIVDFGNVGLSEINGRKFSDLNGNGSDDSEPGIAGVKILLYDAEENVIDCRVTSSEQGKEGTYSFTGLLPGTYTAAEVKPSGTIATTPTSCEEVLTVDTEPNGEGVISCAGTDAGCSFGNVCLGAGGGLTLGYWSNKNGQGRITDGDLSFLRGLNLKGPGCNDFNPATKTQLKNWLLSATATNMSYMLSAQLAAMELNVRHGVSPDAFVYAPGCGNFITISVLMNAANTELQNCGLNRSYQECLKNALDNANNNKNFVVACPNFGATCP